MRLLGFAILTAGLLNAQTNWKVPDNFKDLPSYVRVPVFAEVKADPALPRVLLIGDSISMYYTPEVQQQLRGKANVYRIPDNGKSTRYGIQNIQYWLGDGKWAVIHFNFGLHDIAVMPDGKRQVSPEEYEKNLRSMVQILQNTHAKLIWATTTPVVEGSRNRTEADAAAYNAVARKVMDESHIPIDDLHAFIEAKPNKENLQIPANVHYRAEGSVELGIEVARHILKALAH